MPRAAGGDGALLLHQVAAGQGVARVPHPEVVRRALRPGIASLSHSPTPEQTCRRCLTMLRVVNSIVTCALDQNIDKLS